MPVIYQYSDFTLTEEMLKSKGYEKRPRRPRCTTDYWEKEGSDIIFAVVHRKGIVMILCREICEKIGWHSISIRDKGTIPTPYTSINGKNTDLHILLLPYIPDGMERDHKFHTRLLVLKENLRICTYYENGYNRAVRNKKRMGRKDGYYFRDRVTSKKDMGVIRDRGFTVKKADCCKDGTPTYIIESPRYQNDEEWQKGVDEYEDYVYGKFRYKQEEDFTYGMDLLIRHYILCEIPYGEMTALNKKRWQVHKAGKIHAA